MNTKIRHAVILAAGRGIRMRPLTDSLPKAMAPVHGSTLIANGIDSLNQHVEQIHVTVGHHGAMLAEHVIQHGVRTVINTEGHGNCWWLYNTFLSLVDEPVLVLTCDNVTDLDIDLLEEDYVQSGCPACTLIPVQPVEGLEGDYIFHEDGVVKKLSRTEPAPTYCSGIQLVNPASVRACTEVVEDFAAVWDQLIPQEQLRASPVYPKSWYTVDTLQQLTALLDELKPGDLP